jgi:type VI secretion system secreted protein Hcp
MAVDIFVKFEKPSNSKFAIIGESTDKFFKDWIQLSAVSFGVENTTTIGSGSGGAGAGKAKLSEISIQKPVDSTSPALFLALCMGAHYEQVTIAFRKPGGSTKQAPEPFYGITCRTVFVTNIQHAASGDSVPTESITLVYGALKMTYRKQKADGSFDPNPIETMWDQTTNSNKF